MYKELIEYAKKIHKDNLQSRKVMSDFLYLKKRLTKQGRWLFDKKPKNGTLNNDRAGRSINNESAKGS